MNQIEDFMDSPLIDAVINQIDEDLANGDKTAICELLSFIPKENLIQFLPEEHWDKFEKDGIISK